jgi:putative endonuclease
MIHICQLLYEITTKKFMAEHNNTGKKGEEMAATFLREKGMAILETNWRFGYLEADIIAKFEKTLVIIEVKTRKSNYFGEPESFVTKQKQKNLIRAANEYIERKNLDLEVRFDIISIVLNDYNAIRHIEDAFYPLL